ncbi:TfpX/TfpZ family type IV pilin accessory protein [Acinetobacter haemolyticus]|uniref:TfpX/TfpZ family type IV pilin accessory protein n=1 Tax=Acinetobacter haemolyticus TaxID=29430 RepID=UPI0009492A1D|nr:TfpX/TfpZ family type IV pilin accessory protein [Acinetobacter haemolyticus]APR69200.1 type IV pilin accessory protein [Acinetobacter haemolyticus]
MSSRLKFFLSHLAISFVIAFFVIGIVFFVWYPYPLAKAAGVTQLFLMMLTIDVIIGPLLGLIVYKQGKKTLKMDLGVIILLQIAALCYGIYSIEQGRPVWVSYVVDRFELVRNNDLINDKADQALPQFQNPSWLQPQYVAVKVSDNVNQRNNDLFAEVMGGISLAQRPERYVELSEVKSLIQQRAQDLELLKNFNDSDQVEKVLAKYPTATAFVPLKANAVDMTVLINKEKGEVVEIVDLRPWK